MEVRLLGPVELWEEGRQLPLRGPLQRGLLALLALHTNRTVAAGRLIDLLWGAAATRQTLRNLQQQVSRLRQVLAEARAAERLVEELGVEPGRPLRQLHRRMLAADPGLELAAPNAARPPADVTGVALEEAAAAASLSPTRDRGRRRAG